MIKAKDVRVGQHICFRPKDFDHIVDGKIINGRVMSIYRDHGFDCVDVYVEDKGPMSFKCDDVYATFAEAKEATFPERQKRFYEETSTVDGLLRFLHKHANVRFDVLMNGAHVNDNDASAVFYQRMREALERIDSVN